MIHVLLQGILLGITLTFFIGPAFFTLLQTSIHRGFQSALLLAVGITVSDAALVILSYLGASRFVDQPGNHEAFGFVGGIILIVFGVVTFTRKFHMDENSEVIVKKPGPLTFILKGFFLNIANPFLWIFWVGVMGFVSSNFSSDIEYAIIFYSGTLGTVFTTDLIKSFIANKIKQYLKPVIMTAINRIVGILLVGFGIVLMWRVIY